METKIDAKSLEEFIAQVLTHYYRTSNRSAPFGSRLEHGYTEQQDDKDILYILTATKLPERLEAYLSGRDPFDTRFDKPYAVGGRLNPGFKGPGPEWKR